MRVLSWNLAYMKPGSYKSIVNRRRQWALIGALNPDIALLQECRPGDLVQHAPHWMADDYNIVGENQPGTGCSAVLARKSLRASLFDPTVLPEAERRWLDLSARFIATATVVIEGTEVTVASVHALASEVGDADLSEQEHQAIKRPALGKAWYNDTAAAALFPVTEAAPFIIGGDWNTALLFDTTYPATAPASAEFFEARQAAGWHHALRKFNPDEVRTYLDPKSAPYELDHLFTDADLHARLTDCHVFSDTALFELSDHAPLVADFTTPGQ